MSVDAVEEHESLTDDGDELEELQDAARDDAVYVNHHADLLTSAVQEIVTLAGSGMVASGEMVLLAEDAIIVEILRPAEGEGQSADGEDAPK